MSTPTFSDFLELDLRVGTVVRCVPNTRARDNALCLWIDLGDDEPVQSSAKITDLYQPDALVGTQVIVVNGFEPMRIGGFRSDVLVLGVVTEEGVVLLRPDSPVDSGSVVA
jgi:tRNA-binding protein